MSINPIYPNNISFKANGTVSAMQTANNVVNTQQNNFATNNAITYPVNIKTPQSYSKIADIPVAGSNQNAELFKLANGHKIVILPQKGPMVLQTFFNVGSLNEPDNLRGISHYIEHNLFNGSDNIKPGEFFPAVSNMGGYTNAGTGTDQTNYHIKIPLADKENLKKVVELHSDQIQNPQFNQEQLDKERGPVIQEICMYADMPSNIAHNVTLKNLFNIQSASPDLIAGTPSNIESITRNDVLNYYNTWYTPDNCVTVVTGNTTPNEIMPLLSANFTKQCTPMPQNKKYQTLTPIQKTARQDIRHPNSLDTSIYMGFAGPKNNDAREQIAFKVLAELLTGSKHSPMNIAMEPYQAAAFLEGGKISNNPEDPSEILLTTVTTEEKSEQVLKEIYNTLNHYSNNPPSQKDLDAIKMQMKIGLAYINQSSEGINEFIGNALLNNNTDYLSNYDKILDSITPMDIVNASRKYLDLNKTAITVMHPANTSNEQINNNYNKTNFAKSPSVAFKGSFHSNAVKESYNDVIETTLPNNIKTAIYPHANELTSSVQMQFALPAFLDVTEPEIQILSTMLNRGSMLRDNNNLSEYLHQNNTNMSISASPLGIQATCIMPAANLDTALNTITEVLNTPRFTQENFEYTKNTIKERYLSMNKSSGDKLMAQLFPDFKFTETPEESLKQIDSISLERIQQIYMTIMQNASCNGVLSAPVNTNPQIGSYFNNYLTQNIKPVRPHTTDTIPTYKPIDRPVVLTDSEDRIQAEVSQAYTFKHTDNIDDSAKIDLMNIILGSKSSSRLFNDLREQQKLAYRVTSNYSSIGDTGIIEMYILTTTDDKQNGTFSPQNVQKSIDGFNYHVNKIKSEQVTADELNRAKKILKSEILNNLETSDDIAGNILNNQSSYYGIDRTKMLLEAIDKVSEQDITATANYVFANPPVTSILASQNTIDAIQIA